jgi:hypothetical protein
MALLGGRTFSWGFSASFRIWSLALAKRDMTVPKGMAKAWLIWT